MNFSFHIFDFGIIPSKPWLAFHLNLNMLYAKTFYINMCIVYVYICMLRVYLSQVCLMGKYHNILYIALRTCWDWGVRDSEVVVQLLGKSKAET